jgi:phospho-N-acetylmuramoyl-pentapeptide-transferase
MGGVVIIAATLLGYLLAKLVTLDAPSASALLLLFLLAGCGAVGFVDDYVKVVKQRSLGLRSKAKMTGLTVVALVFGVVALLPALEDDGGLTPASTAVSFIRDIEWLTLPAALALVLFWLVVTGTSNAVNLADGLDGLAVTTSRAT